MTSIHDSRLFGGRFCRLVISYIRPKTKFYSPLFPHHDVIPAGYRRLWSNILIHTSANVVRCSACASGGTLSCTSPGCLSVCFKCCLFWRVYVCVVLIMVMMLFVNEMCMTTRISPLQDNKVYLTLTYLAKRKYITFAQSGAPYTQFCKFGQGSSSIEVIDRNNMTNKKRTHVQLTHKNVFYKIHLKTKNNTYRQLFSSIDPFPTK